MALGGELELLESLMLGLAAAALMFVWARYSRRAASRGAAVAWAVGSVVLFAFLSGQRLALFSAIADEAVTSGDLLGILVPCIGLLAGAALGSRARARSS